MPDEFIARFGRAYGRMAIPCEGCGEHFLVWPSQSTRRRCARCAHPYETVAERFWAKVDIRGPDECWPWLACRKRDGYGTFGDRSRHTVGAHRFAYFLTHGCYARVTRHTCDTPWCCNPAHLEDGTQAQNIQDSVERGRHRNPVFLGEAHPMARLSEPQVRAIIDSAESDASVAVRYGVSQSTAAGIRRGVIWPHLPRPDGVRPPRPRPTECAICGKTEPPLRRGRCNACRLYLGKYGIERPTRLH